MAMRKITCILGLLVAGSSPGLGEEIEKGPSCSWNPLLQSNQIVCAAPLRKPSTPTVIEVQRPGVWNGNKKRYTKPGKYELPSAWKGPAQCFKDFCLYFNPDAGQGMALITTARNAYLVASAPVPSMTGVESTAYYEADVPGKGIGLIANRTIRKGEVIMERVPALLIQATPHLDLDPQLREQLYRDAVDKLPDETRERFIRQMGEGIYGKVEKNAFRIFLDGDHKHSAHLGIFPEVSRFNHDCRPNVHYRIANVTHTTVAVRDIPAGTELTISYIYGQTPFAERQAQLRDWGFTCTCSQCTLPADESALSDARLRQIRQLEDEIEAAMSGRRAGAVVRPEMAGRLVELYRAERLDAYLAPTYTRAALLYSMFGNEARAREYAGEAVSALEREVGPAATDAESMRRLESDPKSHWSWGLKVTSGIGQGLRNGTRVGGK